MFTGIIEAVGEIVSLENAGAFQKLSVQAGTNLDGIKVGDSIAVNGTCLTVRAAHPGSFVAELSQETLERTSLRKLATGAIVNLERPMRADGRFGGHIVQGHVDGVGRIRSFTREGDNWTLSVEFPEHATRYIVEKGSITIDGISLTVASMRPGLLEVAIIPHTFENTNLRHAKAGDSVNLEFDLIAKYVERMMQRIDQ
jgi:riboflavin synthase